MATGETRWSRPGFRLVAGGPANGFVIISTPLDTGEPDGFDGWTMINDTTGESVATQTWLGPEAFSVGCRGDGFYSHTTRTGGVVISTSSPVVNIWLPAALSQPTVTASLLTPR